MKKEGFEDGRAAGLEQGRAKVSLKASGRAEREIEMAKGHEE